MKNLFYMGGPLFMGILTAVLIILVAWTLYHFLPVLAKKDIDVSRITSRLKYIKTIGTFGLVTGILGQLIGLYGAFSAIEEVSNVTPAILSNNLKISLIPTIYEIFIFLIALLIWFVTDFVISNKSE